MKPLLIPTLLYSVLLSAMHQSPELRKLKLIGVIEVGQVFQDCDHVKKNGHPAEMPIGFLITPDSAFKLALEKIQFRCPSKFGNSVFADNDFYYITVGSMEIFLGTAEKGATLTTLKERSIRVHGLTGKVSPPTIF